MKNKIKNINQMHKERVRGGGVEITAEEDTNQKTHGGKFR